MSSDLADRKCIPCSGDVPPLEGEELNEFRRELSNRWEVVDDHHLEGEFSFDDFQQALDFTNRVGEIAEEEGHHPNIYLTYGKVEIKIWTHAIDALSESDFILAAKIDRLIE